MDDTFRARGEMWLKLAGRRILRKVVCHAQRTKPTSSRLHHPAACQRDVLFGSIHGRPVRRFVVAAFMRFGRFLTRCIGQKTLVNKLKLIATKQNVGIKRPSFFGWPLRIRIKEPPPQRCLFFGRHTIEQ